MADTVDSPRTAVVVNLAAFKAARNRNLRRSDPLGRRLLALRLRTPREIEHRRRMLRHLDQRQSQADGAV